MTGDRLDNDVRLVRILAGGPCVSSSLHLLPSWEPDHPLTPTVALLAMTSACAFDRPSKEENLVLPAKPRRGSQAPP